LAVEGVQYSSQVAAVAALWYKYVHDVRLNEREFFATPAEIYEMVQEEPDIMDIAEWAHATLARTERLLTPSQLGFVLKLVATKSETENAFNEAKLFFESVISGVGIPDVADPMAVLRKRLTSARTSKAKYTGMYLMAICVKAWNASVVGSTPTVFGWRDDEAFPTPL